MNDSVLIIGAGGVGSAVAHKCAQWNSELGDICIAARTREKCDQIVSSVREMGNMRDPQRKLHTAEVDARDAGALAGLIERSGASMVLNVASPYCNLGIIEACLETGADYLDTAVYEVEGQVNVPPPWYANYEWPYRERFRAAGVTGILGIGFDPGAVNAFCAYACKHLFDDIESIDIMDVNAGDHGRFFATNFDPETNLREIMEDVLYWEDGDWQRIPYMSKSRVYDF
ncbi:MAG: saccharopine dehydrogenase NADP-binding domain-containing protein, partial [Gammaproteobacteria bacterium]|nr:saccharopine dehydrogenase NADP-binding domain-containing protein [Gammaproteobacteria bacterium]